LLLVERPPIVQQNVSHGTVRQYLQAMKNDFLAHELTVTDSSYDVEDEPITIPALIKELTKQTLDSPGHAISEDDFCVSLWSGETPVAHLSPRPLYLYHQIQKTGVLRFESFQLLFDAREREYQINRRYGSSDFSIIHGHALDLNPFVHPGISPLATWEYAYEVATLPLSKLAKLGALISKRVRGF
jgi:hypothetical protein